MSYNIIFRLHLGVLMSKLRYSVLGCLAIT